MKISDDDLLDIGTGLQMLEDFIPKILCHSTKNEFAVGKKYALKNLTTSLLILAVLGDLPILQFQDIIVIISLLILPQYYLNLYCIIFFFPIADTTKTVLVRNTHKKATISILQKLKSRKKFKYNFKKSDFLSKA